MVLPIICLNVWHNDLKARDALKSNTTTSATIRNIRKPKFLLKNVKMFAKCLKNWRKMLQ